MRKRKALPHITDEMMEQMIDVYRAITATGGQPTTFSLPYPDFHQITGIRLKGYGAESFVVIADRRNF